ncbi:MAG: hypothetical protein WKF94_17900 [Solirubrobacteraceae bacterium]
MSVAAELLDRFRGRLREVHLSSTRAGCLPLRGAVGEPLAA